MTDLENFKQMLDKAKVEYRETGTAYSSDTVQHFKLIIVIDEPSFLGDNFPEEYVPNEAYFAFDDKGSLSHTNIHGYEVYS